MLLRNWVIRFCWKCAETCSYRYEIIWHSSYVWWNSCSRVFRVKTSRPIRLVHSLDCYNWWTVWYFFLIFGVNIKRHKGNTLNILWVYDLPTGLPRHAQIYPNLVKTVKNRLGSDFSMFQFQIIKFWSLRFYIWRFWGFQIFKFYIWLFLYLDFLHLMFSTYSLFQKI